MVSWTVFSQASPHLSGMNLKTGIQKKRTFFGKGSCKGFPGGTVGKKNLLAKAGDSKDVGLIPGSGRSPGVGNDNPLQYSCQKNSMDRGAWWAAVHGITKSRT